MLQPSLFNLTTDPVLSLACVQTSALKIVWRIRKYQIKIKLKSLQWCFYDPKKKKMLVPVRRSAVGDSKKGCAGLRWRLFFFLFFFNFSYRDIIISLTFKAWLLTTSTVTLLHSIYFGQDNYVMKFLNGPVTGCFRTAERNSPPLPPPPSLSLLVPP